MSLGTGDAERDRDMDDEFRRLFLPREFGRGERLILLEFLLLLRGGDRDLEIEDV